jgi:hypothetical protein
MWRNPFEKDPRFLFTRLLLIASFVYVFECDPIIVAGVGWCPPSKLHGPLPHQLITGFNVRTASVSCFPFRDS